MAKGTKKEMRRPGLSTMKQGAGRPDTNSASLAGNTRGIMKQGSTARPKSPAGNLRTIIGQ